MAVMRRPGIPKLSLGMSAPKRGTSSASIQIHLDASAMSFLAKGIGNFGKLQGPPGDHADHLPVARLEGRRVRRRVGPLVEDTLIPNRPALFRERLIWVHLRRPGERHAEDA